MSHCLLGKKGAVEREPARPEGVRTKPNVWDEAAQIDVWRGGEKLDPGVNYFVLMFEQMGLPTFFSCEGHPGGFYITFQAPYEVALRIKEAGFFAVEIEDEDYWSLRRHAPVGKKTRVDAFRWAAEAWEKQLGPLDFDAITIV